MGPTALYRDPVPWRPPRAEVHLEPDALILRMPDGRQRRYGLDGCTPTTVDGFFAARVEIMYPRSLGRTAALAAEPGYERRFVRMLVLEREHERVVVITPPDQGTVAPTVVTVPEAPAEAAIVDPPAFDPLAEWVMGGGRLGAWAIADLAKLAMIATSQFAVLIGEVAAQRALDLRWGARGPLRTGSELETALQPLVEAAKRSPRAADALVSALAHAAGTTRRQRRSG